MADFIFFLFQLLVRPISLLIAALLLAAAYFTSRQPFAVVKLVFKAILYSACAAAALWVIQTQLPARWTNGVGFGGAIAFFAIIYSVFGFSIGICAPIEVGVWQQLACIGLAPAVPPAFLYVARLGHGGNAGLGGLILLLLMVPGVFAVLPGWILGWFLNSKAIEARRSLGKTS